MSVLVSDRTESKFEAITYSIELHDMLIDFMQHGFGVKSVDDYVRLRYAYGKDDRENFSKYRFMMQNFKNRVDQLAALITSNVRQPTRFIQRIFTSVKREEIIKTLL